jgi:hypothetical protein
MSAAHTTEWILGGLSGAVFLVGGTVATVAQDLGGLPWDKITGTGAAGLVVIITWIFLKRDEKRDAAHADQLVKRDTTLDIITTRFAVTVKETTDNFAETTATLLREARSEASEREKRMQEMFASYHRDKP